MKRLVFIALLPIAFACSSKRTTESPEVGKNGGAPTTTDTSIPACIKEMILRFQKEELTQPARVVYSYLYKGSVVYYVTGPCCDFFTDLYDESCKLIAHPDGGITGRGDGRTPDFIQTRSQEKLIWKDDRP